MTTVRIVDGMKYGFKLLSFFIAVSLICGAFIAGGVLIYQDARAMVNPELNQYYGRLAAGGLLTLVGSLGLTGSVIGFGHKFIADSVTAGYEAADATPADATEVAASDEDETEEETAEADSPDDESTQEPSSDKAPEESPEDHDESSEQGEGIFGIDTSEARAEPTGPRARAEEPSSPQGSDGRESGAVQQQAQNTSTTHPPTSPEERTWQRDEPDEPAGEPAEPADQSDQPETETDPGYPDSYATGPPPEDRNANWDETDEQPTPGANEQTDAEAPDESLDESVDTGSNVSWEDDGDGVQENIDQVVSDATAPETSTVDDSPDVAESADASNGGTLESELEDEPESIDDAPGEFVAKPPADSEPADDDATDPVDELPDEPLTDDGGETGDPADELPDEPITDDDVEPTVDPADELPDEPITDDEIEDTTDEPGDWEPLDESDL